MRIRRPTLGLRWYFEHNDGRLIHKWMHYFEIYERHLEPYRGRSATLLEIGVSQGGSLQMWRHHLGRRSKIVGIDIEPRVIEVSEPGIDVLVGDQSDPVFLGSLVEKYPEFDVVIDDGSHLPAHQIASIEYLWPHVADGGVYIVEDLHSNYWPEYDGGRDAPGTFMDWTRKRIDDMHAFHSREEGFEPNSWTRSIRGLHIYDSVVVLEKATVTEPIHRKTGRPAFGDVYGAEAESIIDDDHRRQLEALGSMPARLRRLVRDPKATVRRVASRLTAHRSTG